MLTGRHCQVFAGTSLTEAARCASLSSGVWACIQYGYESADAFGAAFKKFRGATPTQIRRGAPARPSRAITVATKPAGDSMKISRQSKPA